MSSSFIVALVGIVLLSSSPNLLGSEALTPNTEIVLSVAQDGTAPFVIYDQNYAIADDPLVDGNGGHTPGLDGAKGLDPTLAGYIPAELNGVVRTLDTIRYDIHWNVNDVDSSVNNDGSNGIVTNVTLRISTLREDVRWIDLPGRCRTSDVTPISKIVDNGANGDTLICNLGDIAEGTAGTISPVARVSNKADGSPSDGGVIPMTATVETDQSPLITSNQVSTTISATPAGDWIKAPAEMIYNIDNAGINGVVMIYPISFIPFANEDLRGADPLDDTVALEFYDHAWDLGPSAQLVSAPAMLTAIGRKACAGYDGTGALPYGNDGALPAAAADGINNETNLFSVSCTDITGASSYPIIHIAVSNQDTSSAPEKYIDGLSNEGVVISLQVAFWVSDADVTAKFPNLADALPFWNTINGDTTLDTTGAAINFGFGVVPNTDFIQLGTGSGFIDEDITFNNSVHQVVTPTPAPVTGTTSYELYSHSGRFYNGPYQENFFIGDDGLERKGYDNRERATTDGLGRTIEGDEPLRGWHGTGQVSRNQLLVLHSRVVGTSARGFLTDDPIHLCTSIDNTFMEVVDFPSVFTKFETDEAFPGDTFSPSVSSTTGSPTDGIAHVLVGDATDNYAGRRIELTPISWVRINPVSTPEYIVQVTDSAYNNNLSEHQLTCNNADAGPGGWIDTSDTAALIAAFGTGTDSDGNQKYGGITRIRVQMLEHQSWEDDFDTSSIYVGVESSNIILNMQVRVKPDLASNPDGSKLRIHTARARGDLDAAGVPPVMDCTDDLNKHTIDFSSWCSLPYDAALEASTGPQQLDVRAFDYATSDNSRVYLSHSDRVEITSAKLGLTKSNISGPTDLVTNDDFVTFKIESNIIGSPIEHFSNVYIEDLIDTNPYYEFISQTAPLDKLGNPVDGYVNCTDAVNGSFGALRCDFTQGAYNAGDPNSYRASPFYASWTVTVRVSNAPGNTAIPNIANVFGTLVESNVPTTLKSTSGRAYAYTGPDYNELFIRKDVPDLSGNCGSGTGAAALAADTLLAGDCSVFLVNGQYQYDLTYENLGSADLTNLVIIDTLPFVGDGTEPSAGFAGLPAGANPGDGRTPNSDFSGNSTLLSITPSAGTLECTVAAPASINRDPSLNVSNWTAPCDASATAFRITIPTLAIGQTETVSLTLQTAGNEPDDIYTNHFGARTASIAVPARSNDVSAMVLGVSIGSIIWNDANSDGLQTSGELGISGATVSLLNADDSVYDSDSLTSGIQALTALTDSTGLYYFSGLPSGGYKIQVEMPSGFIATINQHSADDSIAVDDSNIATSSGSTHTSGVFNLALNTEPTGESSPIAGSDAADIAADSSGNLTVDFGFVSVYTLGNYIWADTNGDGIQDASETGINGLVVELYENANCTAPIVSTITTSTGGPSTAAGYYEFVDLVAGEYCVKLDTVPAAYVVSPTNETNDASDSDADNSGQISNIDLTADDPDEDIGLIPLYSLGNYVWTDNNGNGLQDETGTGINNITVELFDDALCQGNLLATQTTSNGGTPAADGWYTFGGLLEDNYCIQFSNLPADHLISPQSVGGNDTQDSDANQTTGQITGVSLSSNDPNEDLGLVPVFELGNYIWEDTNNDGIQDASEVGINGLDVELYNNATCTAPSVETVTTQTGGPNNIDGFYEFTKLLAGDYCVQLVSVPTGFSVSPANSSGDTEDSDANASGQITAITLTSDDPNEDIGLVPLLMLGDYIWVDSNGDGIQDASETGLNGVLIELYDNAACTAPSTAAFTTITGGPGSAAGYYEFTDLVAGEYCVKLDTIPSAYIVSPSDESNDTSDSDADSSGQISNINLNADNADQDIGLIPVFSLGNYVWLDSNADGLQNEIGTGINDITIELFDDALCQGNLLATQVTANGGTPATNGWYNFDELLAGDYCVEFSNLPADHSITNQSVGADDTIDSDADTTTAQITNITLSANDPNEDLGLAALYTLGNFVWADTDKNGIQDPAEDGINGLLVELYANATCTAPIAETVTTLSGGPNNASGFYEFTGLTTGNYCIKLESIPTAYSISPMDETSDTLNSDADSSGQISSINLTADNPNEDIGLIEFFPLASWSVTKLTTSTPTAAGDTLDYLFKVSNTGEQSITDITVSDVKCATNPVYVNGDTNGNIAILSVTETQTYRCTSIAVTQDEVNAGVVSNTVIVSGSVEFGSIPDIDDTLLTPIGAQPSLSMVKTITAGDPYRLIDDEVDYQYVVTNDGNVSLAGPVSLSDDKTVVTCPAVNTIGNNDDQFDPAESLVCTATYAVIESDITAGSVTNIASATAGGTISPIDTATAIAVPRADVSIIKTDASLSYTPGKTVVYTLIVSNAGPSNVISATVTDFIPDNMATNWSCISDAVDSCTASGSGDINDTINLLVGHSLSYTVAIDVPASFTGDLSNTASVQPPVDIIDPVPENNTDTDIDTMNAQADLSIIKDNGQSIYEPGLDISYTITVNNAGPSDANTVTVSDTLPSGTSASWTCSAIAPNNCSSSGTGSLNDIADIAAGTSVIYTLNLSVPTDFEGDLVNTASVTPPTGLNDPDLTNNSDTDTDTPIIRNDPGSISGQVSDENSIPLEPVSISLYVDANEDGIPDTQNSPYATVNTDEAGQYQFINVPVGSYVVIETDPFTYSSVSDGDISEDNDVASNGNTNDNQIPVTVTSGENDTDNNFIDERILLNADLSVSKDDYQLTYKAGENLTYTIIVDNAGPVDAPSVLVSDVFPTGTSGVWSCAATAPNSCTANGSGDISDTATIVNGGQVTYTVVLAIPIDYNDDVVNTAVVSLQGGLLSDPDLSNNTDTDTDIPETTFADLVVTKSNDVSGQIELGASFTWALEVINIGADAASFTNGDVILLDELPLEISYANLSVTSLGGLDTNDLSCELTAQALSCTATTELLFENNQGFTVAIVATPTALGTFTNPDGICTVDPDDVISETNKTGGANQGEENNHCEDTVEVVPTFDLSINKVVNTNNPTVGDNVTFTIVVTNEGLGDATGVEITDALPSGYSFLSVDFPTGTNFTAPIWNVGTLPVGESRSLQVLAQVNESGDYQNWAEITAMNEEDIDSNPDSDHLTSDNNSGNGNPVDDDESSATVTPLPAAIYDVAISKVVDNMTPTVGDEVIFTITVNNEGTTNVSGLEVTDYLPAGYSFVEQTHPTGTNFSALVWTVGNLAAGESLEMTITARVNSTGSYKNWAEVTAMNEVDVDSNPDSDHLVSDPNSGNSDPVDDDEDSATVTPSVATAITLSSFNAFEGNTPGSVDFEWSTATEVGNIGYRLMVKTDSDWIAINPDIIPAVGESPTPQVYYFNAKNVDGNQFVLIDIDIKGVQRLNGPYQLEKRSYTAPLAQSRKLGFSRAAINGGDNASRIATQKQQARTVLKTERRKQRKARELKNHQQQLRQRLLERGINQPNRTMKADKVSNMNHEKMNDAVTKSVSVMATTQPSVWQLAIVGLANLLITPASAEASFDVARFEIRETSVYSVSFGELADQGINLLGADVTSFSLRSQQQAVPLDIIDDGNGIVDRQDKIRFIGDGLDTVYTDTNVYILSYGQAGEMMTHKNVAIPFGEPAQHYIEQSIYAPQNKYTIASPSDDAWFADRILSISKPTKKHFKLPISNLAKSTSGTTLSVSLWGGTDLDGDPITEPDHRLIVRVNGLTASDYIFDGLGHRVIDIDLDQDLGDTVTVELEVPVSTHHFFDTINLDSLTLSYPRQFVANDGSLKFESNQAKYSVNHVSADVSIYARTGDEVSQITNLAISGNCDTSNTCEANFAGVDGEAEYFVVSDKQMKQPVISIPHPLDHIDVDAEVLIIAHPDFINTPALHLESYAAELSASYNGASVIDVRAIYGQYNDGVQDAYAIKRYITSAYERGSRYVVLIGGDTYDYRGYLSQKSESFIPSLYASTGNLVQHSPVDPKYGDIDDDNIPDMVISRLPVTSIEELDDLFAKRTAYLARNYTSTAVVSAGKFDLFSELSFKDKVENQITDNLSDWDITRAYIDDLGSNKAKQTWIDAINNGVSLSAYMGHSSPSKLSFQGIFDINDVANLANQGKPTVMMQWGCWNLYNVAPGAKNLTSALLLDGDKGAVSVVGSSTLTQAANIDGLAEIFYTEIAKGKAIGQAVLDAKKAFVEQNGYRPLDMLLGVSMMGFPDLVLNQG